jgi:hypothetical protein
MPNGHKMHQMTLKIPHGKKYSKIFHANALRNIPKYAKYGYDFLCMLIYHLATLLHTYSMTLKWQSGQWIG